MDTDDIQVGRILSRREALKLLAAAGAGMLAGCGPLGSGSTEATTTADEAATVLPTVEAASLNEEAATSVATAEASGLETTATSTATAEAAATAELAAGPTTLPACVVSPALTEGPYFVDEQLNRSDIRTNSADNTVVEGTPLQLAVRVSKIDDAGCTPLEGAMVDIWHCDALGVYSGVTDNSQGFDTVQQDFLRGYQDTDASGLAEFTTIYPGWYSGRAVHIHFKVRTAAANGQAYEFTSQFFFDDELSKQVYTEEPYAAKGEPDTPNARDGIYQGGGDQLMLAVSPAAEGYATTFDIGLDLANSPAQQGGPGGAPPRGPGG